MKRARARFADRLVIVIATVAIAGNAYKVPSAEFWEGALRDRKYVLIVLLLVLGFFGAFTPFESWHTRSLADRNVTTRRAILASFGKMLEISSVVRPPLPTGDLALHVWKRQRTVRHPLSGVLKRLSTYRMSISPVTRPFAPTKGVGVVGLSWKYNREFMFDVGPLAETLSTDDEFIAYREKYGDEAVMNLTWTQFIAVKHRTAVFAVPIRDGRGRFIGCVSVDAMHGYAELNKGPMVEEMSRVSQSIGREEFECV